MIILSEQFENNRRFGFDKTFKVVVKDWYVDNEYISEWTHKPTQAPCKDLCYKVSGLFAFESAVLDEAQKYSDKGYEVYITSYMSIDD